MLTLPAYEITQVLHEGISTIIYRACRQLDKSSVIVKALKPEYPTLEELSRLRHEYKILENAVDIEGIVKPLALENYHNGLALILPDFGAESLKKYLGDRSLEVTKFLNIAIQLASTLAQLHQAQIIHKDIKPHNIVINPETGQVKFIDFSIASRLERENQTLGNPTLLEGTLAYMSPEQTGRMNRSIDYRTDFYSLGVTFYEMLTGKLPFDAIEPLELVHCHIAKVPVPPHQVNSQIPEPVSHLVIKLLAKTAEDRYQTAAGLKFDLETCLLKLQTTGTISGFIPGSADKAGQLLIAQKLYGREAEVARLLATFERVAVGTTEMMLVSGYSGIGKTVLVNEVHKPIVRQRGYFIAGKFDQFKRNIPFASLIQAFQSLIQQLLTENSSQIETWKEKLLSALGVNGQIIIDVIPEVELIIGKQPPVPELGGTESQNRFSRVFKQFIGVFTTQEHPLVVFLDDLQWADSASLKLIELLMTDSDSQYLLLIGAYRDNEVFPTHPTIQTIEKIQQAGTAVNNIVLGPLQLVHVEELIADTLNESVRSKLLAELLFNKTQGNPFFLTQLLKTLYEEDLLTYDLYSGAWQWNIEQIQAIGITDYNVVELIGRNIRKLPEDTQKVLKLAACIGNTFNLEVLSVVNEESSLVTAAQLWSALQAGLILPLSNEYKIPLVFSQEEAGGFSLTDVKVDYKFLHDRVQQAAYSLIPDDQKKETHLKIGQLLLHSTTPEERKENIFALVNQLNYGTDLLAAEAEKYELAALNLIAGQKAKTATAYESAVKYLNVGLELLPSNSWENQYELTLNIYVEATEAEYLNTNFERTEILAKLTLQKTPNLLDKIKVYEVEIASYISQGQMLKGIDVGLSALKMLGVNLSSDDPDSQWIVKLPRIEELKNMPLMTDPYQLAAMRLLMQLSTALYIARPDLMLPAMSTMIDLSIKQGNSPISAYAYGFYGPLLVHAGNIEAAYHTGNLAFSLLEQFDAKSLKAKVYGLFYIYTQPWKKHIKDTFIPLQEGCQIGLETGDIEWSSYCNLNYCSHLFYSGEHLPSADSKIAQYFELAKINKCATATYSNSLWRQLILNLRGLAADKYCLKGESFDEVEMLPQLEELKIKPIICLCRLAKGMLFYLLKDSTKSVDNLRFALETIQSLQGFIVVAIHNFYYSLSLLAEASNSTETSKQQLLIDEVTANQEKMRKWAMHAPENFQHKYELVEAEKARILGQKEKAIDYYDRAIKGAAEQGYIQEEALANELAAEFQLSLGREKIAKTYMTDAYYGYIRWGAKAKVEDLDKRYPKLIARSPVAEIHSGFDFTATIASLTTTGSHAEILDMASVMKASQAISGEIVLDKLLEKLMKILIENAGAQTGLLILSKQGQFFIEAAGNKEEVQVLRSLPVSTSQQLPATVVNYVTRTQKDVVLNDAFQEKIFNNDPYILQNKPKSLLCAPIIYQGKLTAILYLENNLIAGAFTPKRIEVLRILSAQAAISIEQARLYADLEVAKISLEAKVQERTLELQEKNVHLQKAEAAAQSANHAKSDFLASMSHELRTPLNGILGYAQILKRDKTITDSQKDGLNIIYQCGDHLLNLINDILDLSKIEARKMELHPTDFHFTEFLEGLAEICRIKAQQKGIALIYEPITALPAGVRADEKRLRQVLINLLGNAVKFTETGGVAFKVGYHEGKMRFEVEDTGVGMAPEQLEEIFLPFHQVGDNNLKTEGTGLGLAISRQLVEMMGGKIKVKSTPGKGSIFFFDLDLPEVSNQGGFTKKEQLNIQGFKGHKRKIIVADDKRENRSILVKMLSPLGFEMVEATDGQECLKKAEEIHPDCILMDLMMPQLNGFEATRRIRRSPDLKDVVVIGTSASVFDFDQHKSKEVGCNDFLPKPIRVEELLDKLNLHLKLEWVYEEGKNENTIKHVAEHSQDSSLFPQHSFVVPPPEEMAALFDLVMRGDINSIVETTVKLEKTDAKFAPFAREIQELAKGFQVKKIRDFLKNVGINK
ncbi:AAA family ATPase [Microcoleus sp. FACHB-831]|uniref:hybrid sensor histidine kinase/response regulator n=1 Tax=Microcoleus sp. FACHB-831 TaxID=2692827 RepID=UPI001686EB6A|nr:hybrid sensor histidine kinase/response regulator [Microcoleus sp. FACHB-831]MBD1924542.1 AAA family ATPase [Microcoleus sp. FACHB-831]